MDENEIAAEFVDDAACDAASDLTARLLAELSQARAQLAVADARAFAELSAGEELSTEARNERILARERIDVLRKVLAGVPVVEESSHARSA